MKNLLLCFLVAFSSYMLAMQKNVISSSKALIEAIKQGNVLEAQKALKAGADSNFKQSDSSYTPLQEAILAKNVPLVELLFLAGATPEVLDKTQMSHGRVIRTFKVIPTRELAKMMGSHMVDIIDEYPNLLEEFKTNPQKQTLFKAINLGVPLLVTQLLKKLETVLTPADLLAYAKQARDIYFDTYSQTEDPQGAVYREIEELLKERARSLREQLGLTTQALAVSTQGIPALNALPRDVVAIIKENLYRP